MESLEASIISEQALRIDQETFLPLMLESSHRLWENKDQKEKKLEKMHLIDPTNIEEKTKIEENAIQIC